MTPAATSRTPHRPRRSTRAGSDAVLGYLGAPRDDPSGAGDDDFDRDLPGGNAPRHQATLDEARARRDARESSEADARAKYQADRDRAPARRGARGGRLTAGRRRAGRRVTLGNPTGGRLPIRFDVDGLGGIFAGAVFYALALSVVEYGTAGPKLWFKAKFLNEAAAPGSGPSSTAPAAASGTNRAGILL